MEPDSNPFPKMDILPRPLSILCKAGSVIVDLVLHRHSEVPNSGGSVMLDRELYDNALYGDLPRGDVEQSEYPTVS